jgi:1,2-diacylglycerol 3-alpha-glucosyltransferase
MMTNTFLPHVGGVARSVETFVAEYRRLGHEVLVVAPSFPEADGTVEEEGVVRLPAIQNFNGSDFSVSLPLAALTNDRVQEFAANIIHSHHPFLLGDTALRVGASKHVPVLFTHHTLYEEYTHYVPFDSPALKQFAIELSTNYANLCDGIIAPSQSIADLIQKRGVIKPIEVIPTGVDVAAFAGGNGRRKRKELGLAPSTFVVGHVGRLAAEKNLKYLGEAVAEFIASASVADGKSLDVRFLVVGGGAAETEIREAFAARGVENQLICLGKLTGPALYDAYRAMNVFVFSSFSETQGMVIAEAMAAGLPVVALDASGVREVVRHERNGLLLPAETPAAEFARGIESLRANPDFRRRLRESARRTALHYARERCAGKALGFYEEIRAHTRLRRQQEREDVFAAFKKRLEIEWDLVSEKTQSLINAIFSEEPKETSDLPA